MAPERAATSFSFLAMPMATPHGKEQGKVVENDAAALVHDVQHGVGDGAGVDDAGQAVGLQHGLVGEGTADAQQQARHPAAGRWAA